MQGSDGWRARSGGPALRGDHGARVADASSRTGPPPVCVDPWLTPTITGTPAVAAVLTDAAWAVGSWGREGASGWRCRNQPPQWPSRAGRPAIEGASAAAWSRSASRARPVPRDSAATLGQGCHRHPLAPNGHGPPTLAASAMKTMPRFWPACCRPLALPPAQGMSRNGHREWSRCAGLALRVMSVRARASLQRPDTIPEGRQACAWPRPGAVAGASAGYEGVALSRDTTCCAELARR